MKLSIEDLALRGRALVVALALLAMLGAVVAFGGYKAYDFVENDPQFCKSCHTMNRAHDSYMASGHTAVTCHGCHEADLINNLSQLYHFLTERPDEPTKHAEVPNGVCLGCHGQTATGERAAGAGTDISKTLGHKVHEEALKLKCTACHGRDLHQFEPAVKTCVLCHKDKQIKNGKMAANHCASCHPFADSTASSLLPRREDCLACHAKTAAELHLAFPADAPMSWDCGTCHHPHGGSAGEPEKPGTEQCAKCHKEHVETGALHKLHVGDVEAACVDCHRPHDWRTGGRAACGKCHEDEVGDEHHAGHACAGCHNDEHLQAKEAEAGEDGEGEEGDDSGEENDE